MQHLIEAVGTLDHSYAHKCMKELVAISDTVPDVYRYFDYFASLLSSENSYVRTRGLILLVATAKWDNADKIDMMIDPILALLHDTSALTVRKTIQMLPTLALHKPLLKADIVSALQNLNLAKYPQSMKSLLEKDQEKALEEINAY